MEIYADLHVHLGSAGGRPVKITASRLLTLDQLISGASAKGLNMVGVVDAGCQGVMTEIGCKLEQGEWEELPGGGFHCQGITIIPGCELETWEGVHVLSFFPNWQSLREFCRWWHPLVSNPGLSTQRGRISISDTMTVTHELKGLFGFAHAFTPHKGVYGCCTDRLAAVLADHFSEVDFLELGLSADAGMANSIAECRQFAYLSNSDAHSLLNLGREYNRLLIKEASFTSLAAVLTKDGQGNINNYGLHPLLGKYYRTYCPDCDYIVEERPPITKCPRCGTQQVVMGVKDRISMIADGEANNPPSYHYRVPLAMLPGIGQRTIERLLNNFGSEIAVLETIPVEEIAKTAGRKVAAAIYALRENKFGIRAGGGGKYGHLTPNSDAD